MAGCRRTHASRHYGLVDLVIKEEDDEDFVIFTTGFGSHAQRRRLWKAALEPG